MTASDTLGRKSCAIGDFSCHVIDCGHLRVLVDGGGAAPELSSCWGRDPAEGHAHQVLPPGGFQCGLACFTRLG